ncbi:cupredoxin family copper-binding protein [Streptomyces sp. cg36]|uniref:cupredoxin domain-containing protein n=1 Tax=Streptomyces sp. cg36 TaxID=3238798 RepID=UPI0034E1A078
MRTAVIRRRVAQRGAVFAATAAALGLLASCGSSTHAGNGGMKMSGMPASTARRGSPTAGGGGAPAAPAPSSTGGAVAVKNFAFAPATLTVRVGTTVTWTNNDDEPHTVTSDNGGPLHSPPLDSGGVYRYTFAKSGTYTYFCTVHPFMHGSVVVQP